MAERFTPLIGLAVVVALAFAVVIGAVGLTNPAFAGAEPVVNVDGETFHGQTSTTLPSLEAKAGDNQVTLTYKPTADAAAGSGNVWRYKYVEVGNDYPSGWQTPTTAAVAASNMQVVAGLVNGRTYKFLAETATSGGDEVVGTRAPEVTSTPNDPPSRPTNVQAVKGPGTMTLTWEWERATDGLDATGFQYIRYEPNGFPWTDIPDSDGATRTYTVTGLSAGTSYKFGIRALSGDGPESLGSIEHAAVEVTENAPITSTFTAGSSTPGSNTNYTIKFRVPQDLTTGVVDNVVIKLEDYSIPSTVRPGSVSVTVADPVPANEATDNPRTVNVDGDELKLTLKTQGDDEGGFLNRIASSSTVTISIGQDAGVRNPTEVGDNTVAEVTWVTPTGETTVLSNAETIYRKITLSENAGGRGDVVTATGKGFKNNQGITFWLDTDVDGVRDAGELVLCTGDVGSDDVGSCDFTVSNPPFSSGVGAAGQTVGEDGDGDNKCRGTLVNCNVINAVDGRGNKGNLTSDGRRDDATFELEASISVTPDNAGYGESIQIQMTDFGQGAVTRVAIAGENLLENQFAGTVNQEGDGNFSITIPNIAPTGRQDLKVWAGGSDARTTITVNGPDIRVNPSSVVANQRVSIVGSGFTAGAYICCGRQTATGHDTEPMMTIGGAEIPIASINDGENVLVDNGGNWSAAVDLPLVTSTTSEGDKTLRITDSKGRVGEVSLTIPARQVTITPDTGRLGTTAVVRGRNFPGKNDEGVSFSLEVAYKIGGSDATRVTATPDASGSFEVELRVPTSATIPSTNSVEVRFNAGATQGNPGTPVITTVTHEVPEGTISLSETSGSAGSTVTVSGGGFKNFVPVTLVRVGNLEVTPAPRPSTDAQGETSFDITIPGLDVGIQTVEVRIGDTTASIGFTVTPSGISAGDITPSAEAVENLGEAFVRSFHFNNDNKEWTFYDPAAGAASSQENFISGETYWVLVSATTEAILNGETRNLTCVSGNCWNQIVW